MKRPGTSDLFSVSVTEYAVMHTQTLTNTNKQVLTASVFESVDGIGQEADTAQETRALLFVDLLVVPYTDGD